MKPPLEAPLQALCPSPAHLQTEQEMLMGVRARRAKRSGMSKAIKRKKGEQ